MPTRATFDRGHRSEHFTSTLEVAEQYDHIAEIANINVALNFADDPMLS